MVGSATLAEFLLAQIAEDEAGAYRRLDEWRRDGGIIDARLGYGSPGRILAECEAKRRIVELHSGDAEWCGWTQGGDGTHGNMGYGPEPRPRDCDTLRALALPYAHHRDYRKDWVLQ